MSPFTVAAWDLFLQSVPRVFSFRVCHPYLRVPAHLWLIVFVLFVRPFVKHGFGTAVPVLGAKTFVAGWGASPSEYFAGICSTSWRAVISLSLAAFVSPWRRLLSQGRSLALWLHCEKAHLWQVIDRYPFSRYIVCSLR